MREFLIILLLLVSSHLAFVSCCVNIWQLESDEQAKLNADDLCDISTTDDKVCEFPFKWAGITFYRCTTQFNSDKKLQCFSKETQKLHNCDAPTDAFVSSVSLSQIGFSGGTTVQLNGLRFLKDTASKSFGANSNNKIFLKRLTDGSMYECKVVSASSNEEKITFQTPALPSRSVEDYQVVLMLNGNKVPYFQYSDDSPRTLTTVPNDYVPEISSVQSEISQSNLVITFNQDFCDRFCLGADCNENNGAVLEKINVGSMPCLKVENSCSCKVTNFNNIGFLAISAQMKYTGIDYDALKSDAINLVSSNEQLYNIRTYPTITFFQNHMGSVNGGLDVDVNGYNLNGFSSSVFIDGIDCSVASPSYLKKCKSPKEPSGELKKDFIGNRGLFAIDQAGSTDFNALNTSAPNNNNKTWLENAYFVSSFNQPSTVWIEGYLTANLTATYLIELLTNGQGILYLSRNEYEENKALVYSTLNKTQYNSTLFLEKNKYYYMKAVASGGSYNNKLWSSINLKKIETDLSKFSTPSEMIKNEVQVIEIGTFADIPASIELFFISPNQVAYDEGEVQILTFSCNEGSCDFELEFDGFLTTTLFYPPDKSQLERALNEIPTMNPDKVSVDSVDSYKENVFIFNVYFSPIRGDANEIKIISSSVSMQNSEAVKGVALPGTFQLKIDNEWTSVINFQNDSSNQIVQKVNDLFKTRCANSIATQTDDVYAFIDYEVCYRQSLDNANAFCGRKSCQIYYENIFDSIDASVSSYKQICFAYLSKYSNLKKFHLSIRHIDSKIEPFEVQIQLDLISDSDWHYTCIDISKSINTYLTTMEITPSSTLLQKLRLFKVYFYGDMFIDIISLRAYRPVAYVPYSNEGYDLNARKLPKNFYQASVVKTSNLLKIDYQPSECNLLNSVSTTGANFNVKINTRGNNEITGTFSALIDNQKVQLPISTLRTDILQFFKDSPLSQNIRAENTTNNCHYLEPSLLKNWESLMNK